MNHLAHTLLSGADDQIRLGGMLGDFTRGTMDPALPVRVQQGIALHRAIDSFTDQHTDLLTLRARFQPPFRRYAGILIDIWFDHLLARGFERWSSTPLPRFSQALVALLDQNDVLLPESLRSLRRYMQVRRLPAGYAQREMIGEVLAGVSSRLSRENPLATGMLEISRLEPALKDAFDGFFPQLTGFARQWLGALPARTDVRVR